MIGKTAGDIMIFGILRNKVALLFAFVLCAFPSLASDEGIVALLTTFKSSEYVENKSHVSENGTLTIIPPTHKIELKVESIIDSDEAFSDASVFFELDIDSDYRFRNSRNIVLLVKINKNQGYEILDYSFVYNVYCFNEALVSSSEKGYYFKPSGNFKKSDLCRVY